MSQMHKNNTERDPVIVESWQMGFVTVFWIDS